MKNKESNSVIKIFIVIDGKLRTFAKKYSKDDKSYQNDKKKVTSMYSVPKVVSEYMKKNSPNLSSCDTNICGMCMNMTKCDKVIDRKKKPIKSYMLDITNMKKVSQITAGYQVIVYDELEYELYKKTLRETINMNYNDISEEKKKLIERNGITASMPYVFECIHFIDDNNRNAIYDKNLGIYVDKEKVLDADPKNISKYFGNI